MHLGPLDEDEYLWEQELADVIEPADVAALDRAKPRTWAGTVLLALALLLGTATGCVVGWWLP